MTTPAVTEPNVGGEQFTIDELESQFAKPEGSVASKPDEKSPQQMAAELFSTKLEGDHIPESIRGKSIAEIVQQSNSLERALSVSEDARKRAVYTQPYPSQPAPVQPDMTPEKMNELFLENPFEAVRQMLNVAGGSVLEHVDRRLQPLAGAGAAAAQRYAEQAHALEFKLFKDQIDDFVKQSGNPSAWSDPKSWDDLVSYIRGRPENIDKYYEARSKTTTTEQANAARTAEAGSAGASLVSKKGPSGPAGKDNDFGLDEIEKEICRVSGWDYGEYHKWKNPGGR